MHWLAQSYEIYIDKDLVANGNVSEDFSVVGEPLLIDDTSYLKPEDWIDDEYIADEAAIQLMHSLKEFIVLNGDLVHNPELVELENSLRNPDYKGPWQPRQIPNPKNIVAESADLYESAAAIGFQF